MKLNESEMRRKNLSTNRSGGEDEREGWEVGRSNVKLRISSEKNILLNFSFTTKLQIRRWHERGEGEARKEVGVKN